MGSTGRRKGIASFDFFRLRTVDWQKRNWAILSVVALEELGIGVVPLVAVVLVGRAELAADAGGGVADFEAERMKQDGHAESARQ
jgi:hypothetical protein